MKVKKPSQTIETTRLEIARLVRELRRERHFTQAELSARLGMSQSRLCEIEKGGGSFTAEQFLLILQLFNVAVSYFASKNRRKPEAGLQNALARLGATHLQENPDILPSERLEEAGDVIRETLISADSPRHITALVPVLVRNIDCINLKKLEQQFKAAGLERRLAWLIENTHWAVEQDLSTKPPRPWAQFHRRAIVVLSMFLDLLSIQERGRLHGPGSTAPDILDADIRSRETLEEVIAFSSEISRRWSIATSIQPNDCLEALRAARAGT